MTAEVQPYVCDEAEARELTDAIKNRAEQTWQLIEQAYQHRAWSALGYETWDAYCAGEFGATRLRLPREERSEVVKSLRDSGMSIRAIASATGHSDQTVQRDLRQVSQITTPATDPLAAKIAAELAASDQTYAAQAASTVEDIADAEIIDDPPAPAPVTGLDGKTYQPTGRKPPRKALVEVAKTRGFALRAATDSLMRLFDDDRYRTNEKQVADVLRGHLLYVAETVTAVIDQLP